MRVELLGLPPAENRLVPPPGARTALERQGRRARQGWVSEAGRRTVGTPGVARELDPDPHLPSRPWTRELTSAFPPFAGSVSTPFGARFISTSSVPASPATQVPDFSPYTKGTSETKSRAYSYFMVGSMGLITAAGAKSLVSDFLTNMSASSDVLALAKVEVDLSEIPEGKVRTPFPPRSAFLLHQD